MNNELYSGYLTLVTAEPDEQPVEQLSHDTSGWINRTPWNDSQWTKIHNPTVILTGMPLPEEKIQLLKTIPNKPFVLLYTSKPEDYRRNFPPLVDGIVKCSDGDKLLSLNNLSRIISGLKTFSEIYTWQPTLEKKSLVAVTYCSATESAFLLLQQHLITTKWQVIGIHADGFCGQILEYAAKNRLIHATIELSSNELAYNLLADYQYLGVNRLTGAAIAGIPQVICTGGLDAMTHQEPVSGGELPTDRAVLLDDQGNLFTRLLPPELDLVGQEIASKACASSGKVAILHPTSGLSDRDRPISPFWHPEANATLWQSMLNWVNNDVTLQEIPQHMCEETMVQRIVETFLAVTK
ncbi:MAG: Tm-1-like ATP-binding domain-containing protein [Zavarzinella sp.]